MNIAEVQIPEVTIERKKKIHCMICNKNLVGRNFYRSASILAYNNRDSELVPRQWICKGCICDIYKELNEHYDDTRTSIRMLCQLLDCIFDSKIYESAEKESSISGTSLVGIYMKNINSLPQYKGKVFANSSVTEGEDTENNIIFTDKTLDAVKWTNEDDERKKEVLEMLSYDPFENETVADKKSLYRDLLAILDENMAKDLTKSKACIEVVKGYNHIDKIQKSINDFSLDTYSIQENAQQIKQLMELKDKESKMIATYSKDHGLAERYALSKTRGDGTLTGVLRKMNEEKYINGLINMYDIKTIGGMKQASDINSESIFKQLSMGENDYTEIIKYQRKKFEDFEKTVDKLEEENRKLKIKIKEYNLEKKIITEDKIKNEVN